MCERTSATAVPHKQDTFEAHGAPLGEEEVRLTRQQLGWPFAELFHLPDEVLAFFRQALVHGAAQETAWQQQLAAYRAVYPVLADEYEHVLAGDFPCDWESQFPSFQQMMGRWLRAKPVARYSQPSPEHLWNLVGGSADLNPSTNMALAGRGDFQRPLVSHSSAEMEPASQGAAGGAMGPGRPERALRGARARDGGQF